jgi:hypothetical protein
LRATGNHSVVGWSGFPLIPDTYLSFMAFNPEQPIYIESGEKQTMTSTSLQQFGKELKKFFALVLLNLVFGALAMAVGMQVIVATFLQYPAGETYSFLIAVARILLGIAGVAIGLFWILASAKILRGISEVRKEYRNRAVGPVPDETLTGWIIAVLAHYRENRTVIRWMTLIATAGGLVYLALGIANLVQGSQALTGAAGQGPWVIAFTAAAINLTIGLVTIYFSRGFHRYSQVWDLRLEQADSGEESLKRVLESG